MTTDLALTLSFEGIGLLTRVPDGWHLLGEVTLDSADLAAELAQLRAQAVAVGGETFQTTLVLPNDQIKYLTLPAGRMSRKKRLQVAQDTLEAETPYRADELIFDIDVSGAVSQVAAVARDTLAEAEAFAVEHAFNPVGFTAIPQHEAFGQAPDFGASQWATDNGLPVQADKQVIVVTGRGPLQEPASEPIPDPEPVVKPVAAPEGDTAPLEITEPDVADKDTGVSNTDAAARSDKADVLGGPAAASAEPGAEESPKGAPEPAATEDKQTDEAQASSVDGGDVPVVAPAPAPASETPDNELAVTKPKDTNKAAAPVVPAEPKEEAAPAAFASIRAQKDTDAPAAGVGLGGVTRSVSGTNAPSIPSGAADTPTPPLRFDPAKAVAGLTSDTQETEVSSSSDSVNGEGATFASARSKTKVAGPAPKVARKDPKPRSKKAVAKAASANERRNMTVFGARPQEVGGKPRHLGLILTTLLLVFLALVALWATYFTEDGIAGLFGIDDDATVVADAVEAPAPTETDTAAVTDVPEQPQTQIADTENAILEDAPQVSEAVEAARAPSQTDEIGRASCRERVCMFV